jgi:uncharacterized protein
MTTFWTDKRYLSLETFRISGASVRTPVWFAEDSQGTLPGTLSGTLPGTLPGTLYVYSRADAGKVKRIRRKGAVRIAPCDIRGKVTGSWRPAAARIVAEPEAAAGMRLLNAKYWPWKKIGDLFARLAGNRPRVVIAIEPDPA